MPKLYTFHVITYYPANDKLETVHHVEATNDITAERIVQNRAGTHSLNGSYPKAFLVTRTNVTPN